MGSSTSKPVKTYDMSSVPANAKAVLTTIDEESGELGGTSFSDNLKGHEQLKENLEAFVVDAGTFIQGGNDYMSLEAATLVAMNGGAVDAEEKMTKLHKEITERVENLSELRSVLKDTFEKLHRVAKKGDDQEAVEHLLTIEGKVLDENDNQLNALKHVLNIVVKPTSEEIKSFLKKNTKFSQLIKLLGKDNYGKKDASHRLSIAYTNLNDYSKLANKVNDALKTVGLSETKYEKLHNLSELKEELSNVVKKIVKEDKDAKIVNVFKAIHLLEHSMHKHNDIVKFLKKKSEKTLEHQSAKQGGKDLREKSERKLGSEVRDNLVRKLKENQKVLSELINYFVEDMNKQFESIYTSMDSLAPSIGKTIRYDQSLIDLVEAFQDLDEFSNELKLYSSLLEINDTVESKEIKHRFIKYLDNIKHRISALEHNEYLKHISTTIDKIKDTIDTFSDSVKDLKKRVRKEGGKYDDDDDDYEYIPEEFKIDENMVHQLNTNIAKTVGKLGFYANVASIRQNMIQMAKEQKLYSENYEERLGKSIADQISHINATFTANIAAIDDETNGTGLALKLYNDSKPKDEQVATSTIKTIYQWQYDARIELYKTIEAIDLYLMHFTDAIASNPDAVLELNKMLTNTKVITKWYNDKSGNNLIDVFESFNENTDKTPIKTDDYKKYSPVDLSSKTLVASKIKSTFEACKKAIDSIVVVKNILSFVIHIGEKFGNLDLNSKLNMHPNTINKNLVKYIWASSFSVNIINGQLEVKIIGSQSMDNLSGVGLKSTDTQKDRDLQAAQKIGKQLLQELPLITQLDDDKNFSNKIVSFNKLYNDVYRWTNFLPSSGDLDKFKSDLRKALQQIEADINRTSSVNTIFVEEDQYFILTIKALVAKVLTVVGTHCLLKKPDITRNKIMNPTRQILGGASDPEIINEAIELYIRLPLLVEFYRNIFDKGNKDFKKSDGVVSDADTEMIAYIPEVGSIWSGLIQTIFDKSKYIDNSVYSSENIKNIIKEVNSIFKHYMKNSNKHEIVRTTILELVAEINRRYGIIKRKDLAEYYKYTEDEEELYTIKESKDKSGENLDFDIFGDDKNIRSKSNPSEEYIEYESSKSSKKYKKYIKTSDYKIIENFRNKIKSEFNETNLAAASGSLNTQIKYYINQINKLSDNTKKYNLVVRAIEDVNNVNSTNKDAELMFHEVVVTPLVILNQLYIYTDNFIKKYHEMVKFAAQPNPKSSNTTLEKQKKMILDSYGSFILKLTPPIPLLDMTNLHELLSSFTNDMGGLVELKFVSKNKLTLDTSKLQEYVESSLNNIKYMISKFTNIIDKSIIQKYEKVGNYGSIYNIEDKFINKMLNNKNKKTSEEYALKTFQSMELSLPYIIDMIQDQQVSTTNDYLYSKMIWDERKVAILEPSAIIKDIFREYDHKLRIWKPHDLVYTDGRIMHGESILATINRMTLAYLDLFYDNASKKIYYNLFKSFTSDIISNLPNKYGFADRVGSISGNILPKNSNVISSTLAYTMRVLNNRTLNRQLPEKYHLIMTLNEVAPHMIEKMKSQLPTFIKLYELYIKKCLLYSKLFENEVYHSGSKFTNVDVNPSDIKLNTTDDNGETIQIADDYMRATTMNGTTRLGYYRNLLNNAVEAARCIINDANSVLDEIHAMDNSSVLYFDTKKNFIKNFYDNTKEYPFMPLSLMTTIFNYSNDLFEVIPDVRATSAQNKLIYGSRSILVNNKDVKLDNLIYVKHLFTKFNNYSNKINNIETDKINDYVNINVQLLRFLSEKTIYNSTMDTYINENILERIGYFSPSRDTIPHTYEMISNSVDKVTVDDLIALVENTSVDSSENKISTFINSTGPGSSYDRTKASLINIIDMNLVPINIHALMREIPLINIYNYAFTFDSIVERDLASKDSVVSEFKKLLLDPYTPIKTSSDPFSTDIDPNMKSLYSEMPTLNLDKPRFLSDGIYDKFFTHFNGSPTLRQQRLDSKLVRNVIFLANIQRFLRYSIRNEMQIINERVVDNLQTIGSQITDYDAKHDKYDDNEFEFKY